MRTDRPSDTTAGTRETTSLKPVSSRRSLLKGTAGAVVVGGVGIVLPLGSATRAAADVVNAELFVSAGERTMIDGLVVPFLGFGSTAERLELPSGQLDERRRGAPRARGAQHRAGDLLHLGQRRASRRRQHQEPDPHPQRDPRRRPRDRRPAGRGSGSGCEIPRDDRYLDAFADPSEYVVEFDVVEHQGTPRTAPVRSQPLVRASS